VLHLSVDTHRSQHRNRREALDRLADLVAEALRQPAARKPTRPPRAAKERRLKEKKRRGEMKKLRGRVRDE
jgi:ribosome-associated protein